MQRMHEHMPLKSVPQSFITTAKFMAHGAVAHRIWCCCTLKNPKLCSVGHVQNHTRNIYPRYYPTKNFCKFCRTFIPVPGTCVSSVLHTRTRNFCKLCTPVPQIPGVRVQHFYTCPEAYVSYVALPYPYPQLV